MIEKLKTSDMIKLAIENLQVALAHQQELEAHTYSKVKHTVRLQTRTDVNVLITSARIDLIQIQKFIEVDQQFENLSII